MESQEIKNDLNLTYDELVSHLLLKYGGAKYDYFCTESCKSKNKKISRTSEGLFCHHIDEYKAILLSKDEYAVKNPFEYQRAERLVYCNVLEHLILHIKIVEEHNDIHEDLKDIAGIGGAARYLVPQINDFFNGYEFQKEYFIRSFKQIENNFDDYITVLKYFLNVIEKKPPELQSVLKFIVTKEKLSKNYEGKIVKRVFERL